ncbi:MAG: glycosyltransferase family 4 protein [Bacteroidota bacterium]
MNRKRVLFFSHYFPPEVNAPANRLYEHARLWIKDIDVTVITNFPNHPDGKLFPGYRNRLWQKEKYNGIDVIRLWTFITPNEGFVLRSLNYIIYMFAAIMYVVISGIKFDILIATTPQFFCALAGRYAASIRRKPFILELRDLWPESIIAVGAIKNRRIIRLLQRLELSLYNAADRIVPVTNSFSDYLVEKGIDQKKIEVIFNGVSTDMFEDNNETLNTEIKKFLGESFAAGYIGTIGMAHSIGTLIRAAEITRHLNIRYLIVGSGAEREKLEKEIRAKNLDNIKIFPIQTKSQIPAIIKSLDVFIVHLKNDPLFNTVIPSKMFEGMIMRKPLLIGVNGESRNIVESSESGLFFEPENETDLAEKLLYYINTPSDREAHGNNGYEFVRKNFDRGMLASKYLDIIKSATVNKILVYEVPVAVTKAKDLV